MSIRLAIACVLVAAVPGAAAAWPMEHRDLAGLTLVSDAVVVAERTVVAGKPSHYKVTKVLRGSIAVGTELDIDDSLYSTQGHTVDAEVVAFLSQHGGAWTLSLSGLRVFEQGHGFRFEQWSNPGGFTIVPQGIDPIDQWQGDLPAIDRKTFDAELASAFARADALNAASAISDVAKRRAAVLAVCAPPGDGRGSGGFYADEVARRAIAMLGQAGDIEGALTASLRDRSTMDRYHGGIALASLLVFAQDATEPAVLRAEALRWVRVHVAYFGDPISVKLVLGLVADPAPAVRAAAIEAAAQVWQWSGGTTANQQQNRKLGAQVRAALARRFAVEQDPAPLFALARAYEGRGMPARRGGAPVAASVSIRRGAIDVDVICLRPVRLAGGNVVATRGGKAVAVGAFGVSLVCGKSSTGVGGGLAQPFAPGTYALSVEVRANRKPVTVPLGTLTADAGGELIVSP